MLKAAAGGGGKGMRLVDARRGARGAPRSARAARRRPPSATTASTWRRRIVRPRHIEIQVLADHHGNAVHLFERECSIQRRHQKVIEESPSPFVTPELRERMGELAVALVRSRSATATRAPSSSWWTRTRNSYFLEMNTRLQVEHPVTEMVTGLDLVKLQIRIAQGEPLPFAQEDLRAARPRHRVPRLRRGPRRRASCPAPGRILALRVPGGPGVRDDSRRLRGLRGPDPLRPAASRKLVAYGADRAEAIARMRRALAEYTVLGHPAPPCPSSTACCATRPSWPATSTPASSSGASPSRAARRASGRWEVAVAAAADPRLPRAPGRAPARGPPRPRGGALGLAGAAAGATWGAAR